jgi:hypothetical protein
MSFAVAFAAAFAAASAEAFAETFAAASAVASVVEYAPVAKVPTVVEGLGPVHIAFVVEPADCWHSVLGMEIELVGRNLQQTGAFELGSPGSEQVAVGWNWLPVEAVGLRSRDTWVGVAAAVCSAQATEHLVEHIDAATEDFAFEIGVGRIAEHIDGVLEGSGSEADPVVVHIDAAEQDSGPGMGLVIPETSPVCQRLYSRS